MLHTKLKKSLAGLTCCFMALSIFGNVTFAKTQDLNSYTPEDRPVSQPLDEQLERKIVGYFPEWAYDSDVQARYMVTDLQWDDLTHIQYSFCMVDPETNKIAFGDKEAAIETDFAKYQAEVGPIMHKDKEVTLDPNLPYKGHFNLLQVMKKQYPDVKLLISVGGWAGSRGFYTMMDTEQGMETFADSCVEFIKKYGFDGVDIDFEYPTSVATAGNPADKDVSEPRRGVINANYNKMIRILRQKLDEASVADGKYYMLTAAVTSSAWVLGGVKDNSYAEYLDFLSVMSYDLHGAWNGYVENLANIYSDPKDTETKDQVMPYLSMEWAYHFYRGVLPSEKILMGIPYYTRGWEKVNKQGNATGLHGTSIKTLINEPGWGGTGEVNLWGDDDNGDGTPDPAGANPLWHVLNLMDRNSNYKKYWDNGGSVPYIWNEERATFLSFEDEDSIRERTKFIENNNLGGALIWVMNGDYGPNPNYVEGSEDPNEGKYTFGNTLTHLLRSELNRMGPCDLSKDDTTGIPEIAVDVEFTGKYDHPNYYYDIYVTNYTSEDIKGGWELSFDLPKSAQMSASYGGSYSIKDNGAFNTVTIKTAGWNDIKANGGKVKLDGAIKLCFSDAANIRFNGCIPVGNKVVEPTLKVPSITSSVTVTDLNTYTVTATIPAESHATSYTLYENNQAVASGAVTQEAQTINYEAKEKAVGTYAYKIVITNGKDSKEATKTVEVVDKKLIAPKLSATPHAPIDGNYEVTAELQPSHGGTKLTIYENNQLLLSADVKPNEISVSAHSKRRENMEPGTYTYVAELSNGKTKISSNTVIVTVPNEDVNELATATLTSSVTSTDTGEYTVTAFVPAKSNATKVSIYEDDTLLVDGVVDPTATATLEVSESLTNKPVGKYTYKAILTDGNKSTTSNIVTVEVTAKEEAPLLSPSISATPTLSDTGKYTVTATIPANSNAVSYTLYEDNKVLTSGAVTEESQSIVKEFNDQAVGKYTYKIELANEKDLKAATVTVEVTKKDEPEPEPANKPATPSISHNNWDQKDAFTISFNMWWGENGTSWKLYEDDKVIHEEALTPNGQNAQSGSYDLQDKEAGTYTYKVELINKAGSTFSNEVKVTVKDSSNGGGNGDNGGDGGDGGTTPEPPAIKPASPSIAHNNWDQTSDFTIDFNMWWGENGTSWKLYEDGQVIHEETLTPNGQNAQSGSYSVTGKTTGSYLYKVELINDAGSTFSNEITVNVK